MFSRLDPELALREIRDHSGFGLEARWAPDGASVIVGVAKSKERTAYDTVRLDPATGDATPVALPDGCRVLDVSADGKTFLVEHRTKRGYMGKLGLAEAGDREVRVLTDLRVTAGTIAGRFSPDGKSVLFTDGDPARKDAHRWQFSHRPFVLDVGTGRREALAGFPEDARAVGVCWSPDGRKLAYTGFRVPPAALTGDNLDADFEIRSFLVVADADGRNPKALAEATGPLINDRAFGELDWR